MNDAIPEGTTLLYRNHGYIIYKFEGMYFLKGLVNGTTLFFTNRQEFVDLVSAVFSACCKDFLRIGGQENE